MARITIRYCAYRISGLHAVRVAARIRREFDTDVEMVRGRYAEFKVLSESAYVLSGADDERLRLWKAEEPGDGFEDGRGVLGELVGDGRDDLVVASYSSSDGAPSADKGYLLSGTTGEVLRTMTCMVPGVSIGVDVVAVGDVNFDGLIDYLLTDFDVSYEVAGVPEDDGVAYPLGSAAGAHQPSAAGRELLADRRAPDHVNLPDMEFRFGDD